jgi:prepilin-type N-terminal cleavage/methylation domain-containing protein
MQTRWQLTAQAVKFTNTGFTLIEILIVVVLIGILSAIAAPSWLGFVNIQRLNTAQGQIYRAMREAQSNAKRDKIIWQVSFQEINLVPHLAIHRRDSTPTVAHWQSLGDQIRIDQSETTLYDSNGIWRVQFNDRGNTNGQMGKITLKTQHNSKLKRCVIISTLIGAMRTATEQPKAKNQKFCY